MNGLLISFGERVRDLRKAAGFSQEKFAALVGVHRTYIGMIERGEKNITITNIDKIATALKINISELFKDL
ncbi:helix-turn-helix domain-containing protein [Prevotella sp. HUN102]|uniref:helix-turn-helix domain-containing protein n=1 Tax=Prevotella sp. HUN102 TaxID=1392486 RepID=UPI00048EE195|nr:helix-turn-helix transcriptional regulator [Prevotella sp. HUN102]